MQYVNECYFKSFNKCSLGTLQTIFVFKNPIFYKQFLLPTLRYIAVLHCYFFLLQADVLFTVKEDENGKEIFKMVVSFELFYQIFLVRDGMECLNCNFKKNHLKNNCLILVFKVTSRRLERWQIITLYYDKSKLPFCDLIRIWLCSTLL